MKSWESQELTLFGAKGLSQKRRENETKIKTKTKIKTIFLENKNKIEKKIIFLLVCKN